MKKVYLNEKQLDALNSHQKVGCLLWGRGTGKTTVMGAKHLIRYKNLPRGKCFISSTTYTQLFTKTLSPIQQMWERCGILEDQNYVVGRKPPKDWDTPFALPKKFENFITFNNGYAIELMSMDRPDLGRGGSYDGGDVDEAGLVKKEHVSKVLIPSIRGNNDVFDHWIHQHLWFYSSVPWKSTGYWLFEYEDKYANDPDMYFFSEATSADNPRIITPAILKLWEAEMSYLEFQVEVLNLRIRKGTNAFYKSFDDKKHLYKPSIEPNNPGKYNPNALIEMSMDFGGWFNCATVYQENKEVEYMIDKFFVKGEDMLLTMLDDFCKKYIGHQFKYVRIWGEPRGHDKIAIGEKIYTQVANYLRTKGWEVEIKAKAGRTNDHIERHNFMIDVMNEHNARLPKLRVNEDTCKEVVLSIQLAELTHDGKKDKSKEKDRNYPQEQATHLTDTVDYYFMQKHYWKVMQKRTRSNSVDFM